MPLGETLKNVAKDTLGISGAKAAAEYKRRIGASRTQQIKAGAVGFGAQVFLPLTTHEAMNGNPGLDIAYEEPGTFSSYFKQVIDVVVFGGTIGLANSNPSEALQIIVGGKLIQNAASSAIPRAIDSIRERLAEAYDYD